ncbi:hypothetical protein NY547_01395 [Cnuibacter physcomitrellae]|uniref:DUF6578 domain-containing protein n=1 Tax=Cnuibacter physcomitrellae TaxID=1619308 RepID=UPI002175966C|nr:DUF6578 domain-containing protein [Cnuibacter physcomitrellae]MCS5495895.1 hypothetical protein [Cnuibacter physcomitrellae]
MIVDVVVSGWEQACCGEPFGVGRPVTWSVFARDLPGASRRRFLESHHGGLDLPGESGELSGVVREIVEVRAAVVEIPGTRTRTRSQDAPSSRRERVDHVTKGVDVEEYLVALEVDETADLPAYRLDETERRLAEDAEAEARAVDEWIRSPRGRTTNALLASLRERYGDVVQIRVRQGGRGVTIQPLEPEACDLLWTVDADTISVTAGSGSFALEGIDELSDFADAVAAGRVREERRDGGAATVVSPVTGPERVDSVESPGEGMMLVPGDVARRLRAPARRYAPWR